MLPVLRRPHDASPSQGVAVLLVCGLVWALFCLNLDLAGHEPTRAPVAHWYRWQAALVVPWLRLMGEVYAWVAARLGAVGARGPLMVTLGVPLLVGFVVPDVVVYGVWGFEALWPAMLGYGLVTAMWSMGWAVGLVRRVSGLSWGRAALAVVPAWVVQALVGSLLLR